MKYLPFTIVAAAVLFFGGCASRAPAAPVTETPSGEANPPEVRADSAADLVRLTWGSPEESNAVVSSVLKKRDKAYIPVFMELLRASQIGLAAGPGYMEIIAALEVLSGRKYGEEWSAWINWYAEEGVPGPDGFVRWKGRLYSQLDTNFELFFLEDKSWQIRPAEALWGGVSMDGIPPLEKPAAVEASEAAGWLGDEEPVIGVFIAGEAKAYPLRIIDWHEMVNDRVGGRAVSLAYCTLCGAAVLYDGLASDGKAYTFGTSGFLFRSNKLMYDRETRSLWNQLTGRPVAGALAGRGLELRRLPVTLTSWGLWKAEHPGTLVLDKTTGFDRPYEQGAAYGEYFASSGTMFPAGAGSSLFLPKERVFALVVDGVPAAVSVEAAVRKGAVAVRVADSDILVTALGPRVTVAGRTYRGTEVSYDAGADIRAYRTDGRSFVPEGLDKSAAGGGLRDSTGIKYRDGSGDLWTAGAEALLGPGGKSFPRLPGHLAYWFGWFAMFPKTAVFGD